MDSTMTAQKAAIAAGGAVTALGLGVEQLEQALCGNCANGSPGLRECPRLAGKGYQSTVCGFVPDEAWSRLRQGDCADVDTPAFLLAGAALREALANL